MLPIPSMIGALFLLLLGLLPGVTAVAGEGIRVVQGESLELALMEPSPAQSVQWTLERESTFLESQTTPLFQRVFQDPGFYTLHVKTVDIGGKVQERRFAITVDVAQPLHVLPLKAVLKSLPLPHAGTVTLPRRGGALILDASTSQGDIREYRFDLSAALDSDSDGIKDNDADNRDHPSLRTGEPYPVSIRPGLVEETRTVTLTVLSSDGREEREILRIHFREDAPLMPVLTTSPPPDAGGAVALGKAGGIVRMEATESEGLIRQYILDTDIAADTDGDGDAANDHDAAGTKFARTGEPLFLFFAPREGGQSRLVRLTVVDTSGNSRATDLPVHFRGGPATDTAGASKEYNLSLIADAPLRAGEVIVLRVTGDAPSPGGVTYAWDSGADGRTERETEEPILSIRPDAEGLLIMRVSILDASGREQVRLEETFDVEPASMPSPAEVPGDGPRDIGIETAREEEGVRFSPVVPESLDLASFDLLWAFGDGETSALERPVHHYEEAGTYTVGLELRDPQSGTVVAAGQSEVRFTPGVVRIPEATAEEGSAGALGDLLSGFLVTAGAVLLIVVVLFLALAGAFILIARKRGQSPREFLARIRGGMEISPSPESSAKEGEKEQTASAPVAVRPVPKTQEKTEPPIAKPPPSPKPPSPPPPSPALPPAPPTLSRGTTAGGVSPKAEVPPWLKQASTPPPPPGAPPPSPEKPSPAPVKAPAPSKEPEVIPAPPKPAPAPQQRKEEIPPWLQQKPAAPPPAPALLTPVSPPSAPPQPVSAPTQQAPAATKAPAATAPAWLQKGVQEEPATGTTPSLEPPIAIVRAEGIGKEGAKGTKESKETKETKEEGK